jgi:chemotaxis protein MotB
VNRRVARAAPLRASGDRWLFGYADIFTLLFACFAALYATRLAPVAAAPVQPSVAPVVAARPPVPVHATSDVQTRLAEVVGREGTMGGVEVSDTTRGIVISLPEAGSFAPGRAELSIEGRRVMLSLAGTLLDLPNLVRVEGHTDDVPIRGGTFASNWELSTARATEVVEFLIEQCGLDPSRLSAAGYAEYRPRVPNDSPAARARNRRVDIVVLDAAAATLEAPANQTAGAELMSPRNVGR